MNALENCTNALIRKTSWVVLMLAFLFSGYVAKATTEYHYFEEYIYPQVGYYVTTLTVSYSPDEIIACEAEFLDPTIDDLKLTVEISNDGMYAYIHLSRTDNAPFDGTEAAPEVGVGSMAVVDLGKTHSELQISVSHSMNVPGPVSWVSVFPNPVVQGSNLRSDLPLGTTQLQWMDAATGRMISTLVVSDAEGQAIPAPTSAGFYCILYRGAAGQLLGRSKVIVQD